MLTIRLKDGKDKAARRHHPWVFSGAIDSISEDEKGFAEVLSTDD